MSILRVPGCRTLLALTSCKRLFSMASLAANQRSPPPPLNVTTDSSLNGTNTRSPYQRPAQAKRKRIIICCDGTWQTAVSGTRNMPSNVVRLARSIALAGTDADGNDWQQVVHYDAGVGTGAVDEVEKVFEGGTGAGIIINIIEAYNFIVNNYYPGDQIFCFGFSRGAFTARAVAGLVNDIGVIKPQCMHLFPALFHHYKLNTAKHDFRCTRDYFCFVKGLSMSSNADDIDAVTNEGRGELTFGEESRVVQLIGCFDTVGSLGIGDVQWINNGWSRLQYEWMNVKLSPYTRHAYHALALDERRQTFLPTLWYIPSKDVVDAEKKAFRTRAEQWQIDPSILRQHPNIKDEYIQWLDEVENLEEAQRRAYTPDLVQTWFTGCHINIGGGYEDVYYGQGALSNLTYAWMVDKCAPYLAFQDWTFTDDIPNQAARVTDEYNDYVRELITSPSILHQATIKLERAETNLEQKFRETFGLNPVSPHAQRATDPHATAQARHWAQSEPYDSLSLFYRALHRPVHRTPGECNDMSVTTCPPLKTLGETNEWIHPSVFYRMADSKSNPMSAFLYQCPVLDGFVRKKNHQGIWGYAKGDVWLPQGYFWKDGNIRSAEWGTIECASDRTNAEKYMDTLWEDHLSASR